MKTYRIPVKDMPNVDVLAVLEIIPVEYRMYVAGGCTEFFKGRMVKDVSDDSMRLSCGDWEGAILSWMCWHEKIGGYPAPYVMVGGILWGAMQAHGYPPEAKRILEDWAAEAFGPDFQRS
jgi:hypothetical protein